MSDTLLSPPVAFALYLGLAAILNRVGRLLAGTGTPGEMKSSPYASGEAPSRFPAAPGYRPFFVVALFFAVLHLGVLVLATGGTNPAAVAYLLGLMLALLALMMG